MTVALLQNSRQHTDAHSLSTTYNTVSEQTDACVIKGKGYSLHESPGLA